MTKKLRAIIDNLSTVPGRLQDAYDKGPDGRWYLQVEPVDGLSLGEVEASKADADRCFEKLAAKIRSDVLDTALRDAGGDRTLLEPHLAAQIQVDRQSLVVRVLGPDGKFTTLKSVIDDLRKRPGFAAAFDNSKADDRPVGSPDKKNLTELMAAEKARRAAAQATEATKPMTLDPRDSRFSLGAAMAWAKGHPDRVSEIQRQFAGH